MLSSLWKNPVRPLSCGLFLLIPFLLAAVLFSLSNPFSASISFKSFSWEQSEIWSARRVVDWRPCELWKTGALAALLARSNGFIRLDCYGGLNQMRRDLCDGIGIAQLLNATLVLPKFEVASYWNEYE